jgi:predicted MFS family arabinose efflux permease
MVRALGSILAEYWAQVRGAGRNAQLYLWGVFLFGVGQSIFSLLFNLYLRALGFQDSSIGQILSKAALGATVAAIPAAVLFRRFPFRSLLMLAAALTTVTCVLQATLTAPELLLFVAFQSGMSIMVFRLSIAPVIMRESEPGSRPFLFSASFGVLFVAAIVGFLLGGALPHLLRLVTDVDRLALRGGLLAASVVTLVAVIPFSMMREKPAGEGTPKPGALEMLRELAEVDWGVHLKLVAPAMLIGLGAGLIIPFLNLYFRDRYGLSEAEIGILFAVMQGFMVLGNLFGPAVSRRFGLVGGVVATPLASVPFMVLLALPMPFLVAAGAFFFRGGLMNMNQPLASHFAMEVVARRDHAVTNSLLSLSWYLAWTVSAEMGGALIERRGYTEPLLLAAGLYVAASLLYWLFFRSVEEGRVPRGEVEIPDA